MTQYGREDMIERGAAAVDDLAIRYAREEQVPDGRGYAIAVIDAVLPFGEGDPFWTAYAWKRDSETLRGLRGVLAELVGWADNEPCGLRWERGGEIFTCLSRPPDGYALKGAPCLACRLKTLRARLP